MSIKFYDSNGKYWGEYDETRSLFIPSEEVLADRKTDPQYDAEEVAKDINRRVDLIKREWEVRHTETNVETMSCAECIHRPMGAEICEEPCHYEPKIEPQTDCTICDQVGRCDRGRAVECPLTERSE